MPDSITLRVTPGEQAIAHALCSLPPDGAARLLLAPGIYTEKLVLDRAQTTLESEQPGAACIRWGDGAYALLADGMKRGTFRTATLRVDAPRVTLRGLCIENTAAPRETVGQAVALYADGDGLLVENCTLRSFQDTLFTAPLPPAPIEPNGFVGPKEHAPRTPQRHTYLRCTIEGDVDFLFGSAAAWFENCTLVSVDGRTDRSAPYVGYVSAPSTPQGQAFGYVFSRCRFTARGVPAGSVYLARPWRAWAQAAFLHCDLGAHIAPAGFDDWQKPQAHQTACFAEYACTGAGAQGSRAPFARALTAEQAAAYTYARFWASLPGEAGDMPPVDLPAEKG